MALTLGFIILFLIFLFLSHFFEIYLVYWVLGSLFTVFVVGTNCLSYLKLLYGRTNKKRILIFYGAIVNYILLSVVAIFFFFFAFRVILREIQYNGAIVFSFMGLQLGLIFFAVRSRGYLKTIPNLSSDTEASTGG